MEGPIIALSDLHLSLVGAAGRVNVLRDINLQVERGSSLSISGPSGAGKTSLLMLISGMEQASSGQVRVDNIDLSGRNEDWLARFRRRRIGMVFQSFHLIASMTALENVALPLELLGERQALDRAAEALQLTGLEPRAEHYPSELSGGEQQRVALARAFVARPPLILADEPTGNLDSKTGAQVIDLLFAHQQRWHSTLLLVTHDQRLAARCQRQLQLFDGQLQPLETQDGG